MAEDAPEVAPVESSCTPMERSNGRLGDFRDFLKTHSSGYRFSSHPVVFLFAFIKHTCSIGQYRLSLYPTTYTASPRSTDQAARMSVPVTNNNNPSSPCRRHNDQYGLTSVRMPSTLQATCSLVNNASQEPEDDNFVYEGRYYPLKDWDEFELYESAYQTCYPQIMYASTPQPYSCAEEEV